MSDAPQGPSRNPARRCAPIELQGCAIPASCKFPLSLPSYPVVVAPVAPVLGELSAAPFDDQWRMRRSCQCVACWTSPPILRPLRTLRDSPSCPSAHPPIPWQPRLRPQPTLRPLPSSRPHPMLFVPSSPRSTTWRCWPSLSDRPCQAPTEPSACMPHCGPSGPRH